jgi:hypothetical protein
MNLLRRANFRHAAKTGSVIGACLVVLAGCAPLLGYPKDPEDTDVTLANLQAYFGVAKDVEYAHSDPASRVQLRNEIILARLRAYDINFADFEKRLYGDGNGVTLGSDLVGLVLGGLTATIGGAGTKAALGAASTGVIGADTAINKDLYYQKTIPALLAQMEADRLLAKAPIIAGMKLSDAGYPLFQAYIDLDTYKNAGSIPAAINAINKDAGNAKDDALDALRTTVFAEDTFSDRLRDYLWPSGISKPVNQAHLATLRRWMSANLPAGVPVETLIHAPTLAAKRKQAISDLAVP